VQISPIPESSDVLPPDSVHLVRAHNPGLLSLTGTNTWVLTGRQSDATIVIDPGPPLPEHLAAIRALGRPAAVVLTHHHADHAEAAPGLAAEFGIPVYAALADLAVGTTPLVDGDSIDTAGWALSVIATPGHTGDSVCFAIPGGIFTGDTLLGGSTTIIAQPSGSLGDYFASMRRLSSLIGRRGFPGHGPSFGSVGAWATHNAEYREERLAQLVRVFRGLAASGNTPSLGEIASATYGKNGEPVAPYVETMADAQLRFLAQRGDITGWN
jgi:glyoxylase-like metal-dependent hydrolase (beta-lactamase superfamily II)